jgi:hypothetical protein
VVARGIGAPFLSIETEDGWVFVAVSAKVRAL